MSPLLLWEHLCKNIIWEEVHDVSDNKWIYEHKIAWKCYYLLLRTHFFFFKKSAGVLGTLSISLSYSPDNIISHLQDFVIWVVRCSFQAPNWGSVTGWCSTHAPFWFLTWCVIKSPLFKFSESVSSPVARRLSWRLVRIESRQLIAWATEIVQRCALGRKTTEPAMSRNGVGRL